MHSGDVTLHQLVFLPNLLRFVYKIRLTDPCLLWPRKLGGHIVGTSGIFGTLRAPFTRTGIRPSPSNAGRTAMQSDPVVYRVIVGGDDDRLVHERGSQDACSVDLSYWLDARLRKLGEETPSRQIEPLEDEKYQEEVREVVNDVKTLRPDDALPVRPRDVYYPPCDVKILSELRLLEALVAGSHRVE